MASAELPLGFRVRLRPDVRRLHAGRTLLGGSPMRALRLHPTALARIDGGAVTVTDTTTRAIATRLLDADLALPDPDTLPPVAPGALTVVVPTRDRPERLRATLAALDAPEAGVTVIVVDDGSRDPVRVAEVAAGAGARLLTHERNRGPAAARNTGLAAAGTEVVAFVDSDVVVTATDLLRLAAHLTDPGVALVGPRVVGRAPERARWFERYDARASSLDVGTDPGLVRPGSARGWLPSACLVARRATLGTSPFDERMRSGEDVDLVWRLARHHRVRYEPDVVAHHRARGSVRGWLGRKVVYGSSAADLARHHGDAVAPAALSTASAIAALALLSRRRWSVPIALALLAPAHRRLAGTMGSDVVAAGLGARGLGWAVRQEAALLLRHWWPLTLLACVTSPPVRRVTLSAVAVDIAAARRDRPDLGCVDLVLARRLDDLAYGTGLWWGCLRHHSLRALLPRRA